MNKIKYILYILILFIISCSEGPVISEKFTVSIPSGNWIIIKDQPVMGPICIFIESGDTINFERNISNPDSIILHYKSGPDYFHDAFKCSVDKDTVIGYGYYTTKYISESGEVVDSTFPQKLIITYENQNKIKFILKHSIANNNSVIIEYSEVTHVYAIRSKN